MLGHLRLGFDSRRGRKYPEPPHPYRRDFQRDRDRIVHSRAFRRLEGKTQVFTAGYDDHFRNRLTHTIEVAQVARTIAHRLELNEDYTETLALAHDLGHPPFGHSGEKELDRQMRKFGSQFEHNEHSLRIVDVLEERYARFCGLNLSNEVREGILKHSREILAGETEYADLLPELRPPLEAQLLDIADEIAYCTADLDDSFFAGMITADQIALAVPAFAEISEQVDTQYPGASTRIRFWEIQREIMNRLIGGLISGTVEAVDRAGVEDLAELRSLPRRLAITTPEAAEIMHQIKDLLVRSVYENLELKKVRDVAARKVGELFAFLMEHPEQLSPGYRECLAHTPPHRVVCDYIAGMTDAFFGRTYRDLMGEATRV